MKSAATTKPKARVLTRFFIVALTDLKTRRRRVEAFEGLGDISHKYSIIHLGMVIDVNAGAALSYFKTKQRHCEFCSKNVKFIEYYEHAQACRKGK